MKAKLKQKWKAGRYTFKQNLLIQLLMMLPLAAIQTVAAYLFAASLYIIFGGEGSGIVLSIFALLISVGASIPMVILKGTAKTERELPLTYYIDWEKASTDALHKGLDLIGGNYLGIKRIYGDNRLELIKEINSVNWDMNEYVKTEMARIFAPWRYSVYSETKKDYILPVILQTLVSPFAAALQIISIGILLTSSATRSIYSTAAGAPFSMAQLPKNQKVFRFLFNAVSLENFESRAWLGKFDER